MGEFMPAIRHYPIVFSEGAAATPLVVLGLKQGSNLFVEDDGAWRAGHYQPGYVRRYPFIVTEAPDQSATLLAIDAASERFVARADSQADASRLFDDAGAATPAARSAIDLCLAFHEDHLRTAAFAAALDQAGLLVPNRAVMQLLDGQHYTLDGFRIVDEKSLARAAGRDHRRLACQGLAGPDHPAPGLAAQLAAAAGHPRRAQRGETQHAPALTLKAPPVRSPPAGFRRACTTTTQHPQNHVPHQNPQLSQAHTPIRGRRGFAPSALVIALSSALAMPGTALAIDWNGTTSDWFGGCELERRCRADGGRTTVVIDALNPPQLTRRGPNALAGRRDRRGYRFPPPWLIQNAATLASTSGVLGNQAGSLGQVGGGHRRRELDQHRRT